MNHHTILIIRPLKFYSWFFVYLTHINICFSFFSTCLCTTCYVADSFPRYLCLTLFFILPYIVTDWDVSSVTSFSTSGIHTCYLLYLGISNEWFMHFVKTRRVHKLDNASNSSIFVLNKVTRNREVSQNVFSVQSKPVIYTSTNQALRGDSLFINHTNDPKVYIPPFYDNSWNKIHYFPWNDSFNYDQICNNVLKRITKNDTFYIISGSFNGGLGHKYLSVFHSITYAILLGRRFLRLI